MNIITVVIPTYNRKEKLQNAIESVLAETRVPLQVHVFDNASTDETGPFVTAWAAADSRIKYTRNEYNIGGHQNYARAIQHIDTEYFVPLADDDWLLPDFLFVAYSLLEENAQAGAAIFMTEARNEAGDVLETYPPHPDKIQFGLLDPKTHLRNWMIYGHYSWTSILWRRQSLLAIGFPYLHTGITSDMDFQLQTFCRFPVYLVNKPGAVYSLHPAQASRTLDVSDVPAWSKVFARFNRTVADLRLFESDDFAGMLRIVQERYKGAWNAPVSKAIPDGRLVPLAALAAVRLGDWTLASSLLDQADRGEPRRDVGLLHALLRSLKSERDTVAGLRTEVVELNMKVQQLTALAASKEAVETPPSEPLAARRPLITRILEKLDNIRTGA
ncbi:glycosyltransferase involved in cell wall biosynthesis [Amorphus suaedae]